MPLTLSILNDFSETPGPRFRIEGEFSGEEFRETTLEPLYKRAKETGDKIVIDLDGVEGFATSFLEEAFGGLKRLYPEDDVLSSIEFKANEEPILIDEIKKCVAEALDK